MGLTQRLGTIPLAIQTDSSNNVGIGGAANASYKLDVIGNGKFTSSNFPIDIYGTTNNYGLRINSVQAPTLLLYSSNANSSNRNWGIFTNSEVYGDFDIRQSNAKDGDMTVGANSTSRLYIRNTGNVGIGTNNPISILDVRESNRTNGSNIANISIFTTSGQAADSGGTISLGGLFDATNNAPFGSIRGGKENSTSGNYAGYLSFQTIQNNSILTERMRITSGGKLCVQCTGTIFGSSRNRIDGVSNDGGQPTLEVSNSSPTADGAPALACFKGSTTTNSDARFIQFYAGGGTTAMGGIVGNGVSNVQFAAISDVREKENIIPINGSLEKILALNPVEFDWIKTKEHTKAGFIAQEVEQIFPEYVIENMSNEGEETRKGLTGGLTSGINVHLVKAIQELNAKVTALENK